MSIKDIFKQGLVLAVASITFVACGDDSSSSVQEDFGYTPSSSSISSRGDIDYKDTLILNKKLDLNIELDDRDSSKSKDSSEIYIDSLATSIPLYIGEVERGSRIRVKASVAKIFEDKIRIKNEHGEYLKALTAVARNDAHKDSTFGNFMVPSLGTKPDSVYRDSNQFVALSQNHYYLEISGEFNNESTVRLFVEIDTAYYNYIGEKEKNTDEKEKIFMEKNDTLRGIISMGDDAPETIDIDFTSSEGYSLNLTSTGTNIEKLELWKDTTLLSSNTKKLDTLLILSDTLNWTLKISPEKFSYYGSGPYAFFNAVTKTRKLEKGEYFTNPDSVKYPGEEYTSTRPKDLPEEGIYRYNLRQEHFIWLGDYKKGDSLIIKHKIQNYSDDNYRSPVTYEILNKKKKVLGTISSTYGGEFKVPEDGPYYLHYLRLNSEPKDYGVTDSLRYVLQLITMVQQPGLLKSMNFYDEENGKPINQMDVTVGDTIRFSNFAFNFSPIKETSWKEIGSDVDWYIPCESLEYINRDKLYSCSDGDTEKEISSNYLVVQEEGIAHTAKLIAQSKADPMMRDTLKVAIIKAAE